MQSTVENTNIPAFLGKLWKMVDDSATDHLISWSQAGNSFIIQNQAQFWYELLPVYYKHNNMSSFVRQLNMYGFHKISTVENGSMDADKDEIQFYHPYFQKDHPEKLINIKRKVTTSKGQDNQGVIRHDDLTKVLTDVKQLRGRQSSVDAQLSAMKQENAVLWRELALLRQKHIKQQQIVNKLIQFLVTLVQPTATPRMGVGVKRRMPLMLHESSKKVKSRKNSRPSSDAGPTIFELENEVHFSPNDLISQSLEEDEPLVNSPSDRTSKTTSPPIIDQDFSNENELDAPENIDLLWDKPEFVDIDEQPDDITNQERNLIESLAGSSKLITEPAKEVFINPSNSNTLISNLVPSGSYNVNTLAGKHIGSGKKIAGKKLITNTQMSAQSQPRMQIATKNNQASDTTDSSTGLKENLDKHLDTAQIELDQLKDILTNCNTFDANALLGLFNDNDPDYGIRSTLTNRGNPGEEAGGPLVSGSELTPANNLIDFTELFDDSLNNDENNLETESNLLGSSDVLSLQDVSLDTPLILKNEPLFPNST